MNSLADPVDEVPVGVVTRTLTVPATPEGTTAVMAVSPATVKPRAGSSPNVTALAPVKFVPRIATVAPPEVLEPLGVTPVTAGALAAL